MKGISTIIWIIVALAIILFAGSYLIGIANLVASFVVPGAIAPQCTIDSDCSKFCDPYYLGMYADCSSGQCFFNSLQLSGYDYRCPTTPPETTTTTTIPKGNQCSIDSDCDKYCINYAGMYADCRSGYCYFNSLQLSGYDYYCPVSATTTTIPKGDQCSVDSDCSKFCDYYIGMYADCNSGYCFFNSLQLSGYDYKCGVTPGLVECGVATQSELHNLEDAKNFCNQNHLCWIIWADCKVGNYYKCQKTTAGEYVPVLHSTGYEYFDEEYKLVCGKPTCSLQSEACGLFHQCCEGLLCVNNICSIKPRCGNGVCEIGENQVNCIWDCGLWAWIKLFFAGLLVSGLILFLVLFVLPMFVPPALILSIGFLRTPRNLIIAWVVLAIILMVLFAIPLGQVASMVIR